MIAEDVNIDVRALAGVPCEDAADQFGVERAEAAHHAEGVEPHVGKIAVALLTFVEVGQRLDLVSDFAVGRKVFGAVSVLDPELAGRLALGGEVLMSRINRIGRGRSGPFFACGRQWEAIARIGKQNE